jgi:hypothetical protein
MIPPAHPSAVRVTANSIHSEWQGLATSVQGNENNCTEVAVYSPASLDVRTTTPDPTDSPTKGAPMNNTVPEGPRTSLLAEGGPRKSTIANGDLLAWL